ncbi:hypothetical protein B5M06_12860 [Comamonas kerstersii]|uniref:Uncharacterized protein n=2 Tax=Comamonas kerstersii TaxID=225992 RepID=A0A1V0BGL2_9BURK|nr:hypothetical protein B5M06_12860 [Comamonas kerstersii]
MQQNFLKISCAGAVNVIAPGLQAVKQNMVYGKKSCTCHHHAPLAVDHDQGQGHEHSEVKFQGAQRYLDLQCHGGAQNQGQGIACDCRASTAGIQTSRHSDQQRCCPGGDIHVGVVPANRESQNGGDGDEGEHQAVSLQADVVHGTLYAQCVAGVAVRARNR